MTVYTVTVKDEVSGPATKAAAGAERLSGAMGGLAAKATAADAPVAKMGGAAAKVESSFAKAASPVEGMATAARGLGAAVNPVTLAVAAMAATMAAAISVVWGLASALLAGARAALAFADMRGDLESSLDALTEGGGKQAVAAIDKLGKVLPFTTERMGEWAKQVAAAGARDLPSMTLGIKAAAAATAIMNDRTDATAGRVVQLIQRYRELGDIGQTLKIDNRLARQLAEVGVNMSDLAKQLGKPIAELKGASVSAADLGNAIQRALVGKGKAALANFAEDFDQIGTKFKEAIGFMFEDVQKPANRFLHEVRLLAEEFTHGTASANVMKGGITAVFTTLFDVATSALHAVHIGFLRLEILALQAAIAIAPAVLWLQKMWREHDGAGKLLTLLKGTAVVLGVIAVACGVAAAGFLLFVGIPIVIAGAVVYAIGWIVESIGAMGAAIKGWASSAYEAATNFVRGLGKGISDGVGWVIDAVEGLGHAVVSKLKSVLRIKSPSQVMVEVGMMTARGMALGLEGGAPEVERGAARLGAAAVPAVAPPAARGGSTTINLHATLNVTNHGADPLEVTEQGLGVLLERLVMQAGLVPAVAT